LKRERDVEIVLVPFELRPSMPAEGLSASEHGLGHSEKVEEHLRRLAREGGFPLVLPDLIPNTHLALTLGELARDAGESRHEAMHRALFGAYFGRGQDLGRRDVLLEVALAQGFDSDDVSASWDESRFDERLEQFRHLAQHIGVGSTPTALVCNELIIGSRPYQVIQEAVDRCLVAPLTAVDTTSSEGSTEADAET